MGRWNSIAGFEPMFVVDDMYIEVNIHVRKSVQTKSTHIDRGLWEKVFVS